jgi:ferredoxin-type protein NapF
MNDMNLAISRAAFLRGRISGDDAAFRPPWAVAEPSFVELCTRCDACMEACPERIIRRGRGGFPEVSFRQGECSFCGDCAGACSTPALMLREGRPWALTAQITAGCLTAKGVVCRICEEQCARRVIRFTLAAGGRATPEIDAQACTGCGACVAPCPSQAIEIINP